MLSDQLHLMVGLLANQVRSWITLIMLLTWLFFASTATACVICFPYPETTLADHLLQSKTVIMAKEKNDKPYSFYAVEVLKGAIDENDINTFIASNARRMLKQNRDDVVVFRQRYGEPEWLYTAYADIEYQKFIRAILKQSTSWQGFRGDLKRIDFFAERLNHSHRLIHKQAYLEVGRAPYSSIKLIAGKVPREKIWEFLGKFQFIKWHSLYILMLGQSRHPDDIALIRNRIEMAATYRSMTNLSAWVAAFIETNPDTGVDEIENLYFRNQDRTLKELKEVCKGLSVLGSEGGFRVVPELVNRRYRIIKSYGTLLENHPQMAGPVARDLTVWQISALVEQLRQIRKNESSLEPDTKMAITHYLSISQRFPDIESTQ